MEPQTAKASCPEGDAVPKPPHSGSSAVRCPGQGPAPFRAASGAIRYTAGKERYDLVPPDGFAELVKVFTFGAEKHEPRNWEKGLPWMTCFASIMRHSWAWVRGEEYDRESGCHHMAHVAWNALALVTYARRRKGEDDRPKDGFDQEFKNRRPG